MPLTTEATLAEGEALLANLELFMEREAEHQADVAAARNDLEAYWASSVSASVMRDYRAGRVINVG